MSDPLKPNPSPWTPSETTDAQFLGAPPSAAAATPPLLSDADVGLSSGGADFSRVQAAFGQQNPREPTDQRLLSDEDVGIHPNGELPFDYIHRGNSASSNGDPIPLPGELPFSAIRQPNFDAVMRAFSGPAPGAGNFGDVERAFSDPAPKDGEVPVPNPGGILANSPNDGWSSSFAKGVGTAAVQGVSGAAGMVGSLRDLTNELSDRVYSWTSGVPLDQAQARDAKIRAYWDKASVVPDVMKSFPNAGDVESKITPYTGAYQPTTEIGGLAQSGLAAGISGALLAPEAALSGAIPNVAGGVAAQGVADLTGSPLLGTAAGMVGGAAAGSVGVGDTLATRYSRAAQEAKAGNVLLKSAQDPAAFQASLNSPPPENIPGEAPTTYQATGDEGIGQLEREVRAAAPAAFTQRAAQQAEAQMAAKDTIQSGAAPEDVGNYFTAQARALNDQWQTAHDQATLEAQNQTTDLGQGQPAQSAGQAISNELTPQYLDIQNAAKGQVDALGGDQPVSLLGGSMRLQARAAADEAQQRLSALYDAVPQDVTASIAPLKQTAQSIYGNMEPAVRATVTPAESAIRDAISQYPNSVPFSSARAIDTLITSNMRNELKTAGYATPAYSRIVQLKRAWENAMSGSVAERAAQDTAAVAAGTMAPEDANGR